MSTPPLSCGGCKLCCKLIAVPGLNKPQCQWCPKIGDTGCGDHENRPQSCRDYDCLWLQSQTKEHPMPPELRPDRTRVVLATTTDGKGLVLHVDPDRPEAHMQGAMGRWTKAMLAKGQPFFVVRGAKRTLMMGRAR